MECRVIEQAIKARDRIKVGARRADIEKIFERDGGTQFPSPTRYVHPLCKYLHLDVDFDLQGKPGQLFSTDDVVTKYSKIYVEYPARD